MEKQRKMIVEIRRPEEVKIIIMAGLSSREIKEYWSNRGENVIDTLYTPVNLERVLKYAKYRSETGKVIIGKDVPELFRLFYRRIL